MRLGALVISSTAAIATLVLAGRIEPLLPGEAESRCFAGTFDGTTGLTFGIHSENRTDEVHVKRLLLRLDRQPSQEPHRDPAVAYHYDWRYDFRLIAETTDKGEFRSAGQCDWTDDAIARVEPALYCFIDCDGGGIKISRTPARSAIDMDWDADGWLRMSACGGGGEILRGGASTKTFRLATAPAEVCKDLPDYSY